MNRINRYFSNEYIDERIKGIDQKSNSEILSFSPYRVEIQPTSFCNRMCDFCSHSIRNKGGWELTETKVIDIINELSQMSCKHISFSGGGEPFEWKKGDIGKIIQYASNMMDTTLTTNGDGFWNDKTNQPENLELSKYCSSIFINTPDVDDNRYKSIVKGNCSFSKTEKVLRSLLAFIKEKNYSCEVCSVVVVSELNYKYLFEIDHTLQKIGVNRIYYKMIKSFEDNNMYKLEVPTNELVRLRETINSSTSEWLKNFLKSVDVVGNYYSSKCWMNLLGSYAVIDPKGNLFICTPTVGMDKYKVGNILDNSFRSLWEGKLRYETINKLNERLCENKCPKECRMRSQNTIIEEYIIGEIINDTIVINVGLDDIVM